VVLLGVIAGLCVLYRMFVPPTPSGSLLAVSLREGSWLALLGSLAMIVGGLWPRAVSSGVISEVKVEGAWSGLSGWTPGA